MFSLTSELNQWLLVALAILGITLLSLIFRRRFTQSRQKLRVGEAVKRLGPKVSLDLLVPDGIDGVLAVDYVVLTHKGILLITVNWFEGNIFGGENTEHWTQVLAGGSYRFPNPLHELQLIRATICSLVPNIPVSGIVLFAGECTFPKDKPEGACLLSDLPEKPRKQTIPPRFETAWELLLTKVQRLTIT